MKQFTRKVKKAFTLIELVVVIAVIAILSAVSVGTYFGVMNNARESAVQQEAAQFRTALRTQTVTEQTLTGGVKVVLGSKGLVFTAETTTATETPATGKLNTLQNFKEYFTELYYEFSEEGEYDVGANADYSLPGECELTAVYLEAAASADNTTATVVGFEFTKETATAKLGIVNDEFTDTNKVTE